MASGGALELKIEKLVAGGDGLAFHDGRAVFVPFALPGERVRVQLREDRKDYARASLIEVLKPNPGRIAPPCGLYGECGGCDLQHLAYPEQVKVKAGLVAESFKRVGKLEVPEPQVYPSIPFAYRNRLQLHLSPSGRVGFMRASSSSIIEAPTCPVAVRSLQSWIESRSGSRRGFEDMRPFIVGKDRFIAFGTEDEVFLEGRDGIVQVRVAGEDFRFHIKGFFQSNLYLLEHFIPEIMAGLGSGESGVVADLYCGVGLFSRFLAKRFAKVVCVEHNPYALDLARENAPGPGNEYHALTTEDWTRSDSARQAFDCVLVDPPRTGLAPELKAWFASSKPPLIVYVSCDPVTLARDAGELCAAGYSLETLKVYDFYPQTHHIECHARFRLD
jgi:tRNA/tmRNA/rRNA uracil-C5-methylase (TrmA/RlmC/RlmD family)